MSRASLFVPLGIFIGILALGYVGFSLDARNQLPSALLGKPFPEFSAPLLLEPEVQITKADLLGQPALVNVWATWCPTCKSEHEQLMYIASATDVLMVGVDYKDRPEQAIQWLQQYGNPYDYVIDDRDGSLGIELGVYGAPETFLLNAAGEVVYKRVGDINIRIWENELLPRFKALEVEVITQAEALQGQPIVGSGAGQ
jgi:cytochrome c biogenesis protein CcmG/thiol:disulfide interchange protein DsbE